MNRNRFHGVLVVPMLALLVLCRLPSASASDAGVKVWEEQIVIPTYLIGPADPNPSFYLDGASQGAEHRIYPYPRYDNLTTEKADKSYKIVYLENEYLKIGILPDIGGKIFEAIDKTNGYNFFYRQHVIKPALISLLGAWISGGVEWDIPHHHRATSFLPVQYNIEESGDGSRTVWVGELELRDRMRWAVGATLRPGTSCLEVAFRMINRTPVPASMLCFSNVAVHANDDYQIIFPPRTQHVTYHAKRDFTTWPIATTRFNGVDFTAGVNVSWYKNHYNAMSMFAWNYEDDFLAGYDHGKHAGTMSVADHHVVPGKKFWTWGKGPRGQLEEKLLTDGDGPYIELMVGAYSDNQPDYTWLGPYETRAWTQFWYPFRDIGGVKNANTDAAVNLDVKAGKVKLGFHATSAHPSATVSLKLKDQALVEEKISIDPGKPFVKEVALPAGADEHDLRAALVADGKELVAYSPVELLPEAMPPPVTPPASPEQIKTNEELYLTGLRIDQFRDPAREPEPYWEEALKRDPFDVRVNTAMAINLYKKARYADAEKLLRKALERATDRYTTPKDAEPFYYLGLVLRAQGRTDDAFTQLYKATWSAPWRGPAYFELAQIDSARGNVESALALVQRSIDADSTNIRALLLKSALLRRPNRGEVLEFAAAYHAIDPLDAHAVAERWLTSKDAALAKGLRATFGDHPASALETAVEYMNAGLWQDASVVLGRAANAAGEKNVSPLVWYAVAYCAHMLDRPQEAADLLQDAARARTDYVFPFQREMIDVLEWAMKANSADSHAPYFLGNLLYDWQPQRAAALWEQSAALGADFPVVYRNLAMVYTQHGARDKAKAALEHAAKLGGNAMVFNDLDQIYEEDAVSPGKRLALLEEHQGVLNRDDVLASEVNLKIFAGKCDDAIKIMQSRFFRAWEGGGRFSVGDSWVNAHLVRGHQHMALRQYREARAAYETALDFPATMIEAVGGAEGRRAEVAYWIGTAQAALDDNDAAQKSWREAAEPSAPTTQRFGGNPRGRGSRQPAGVRISESMPYYQAMAMLKLGQTDRAKAIFEELVNTGAKVQISAAPPASSSSSTTRTTTTTVANSLLRRTRTGDGHLIAGLGRLGLGDADKAKREFQAALESSPDHLAAKVALEHFVP